MRIIIQSLIKNHSKQHKTFAFRELKITFGANYKTKTIMLMETPEEFIKSQYCPELPVGFTNKEMDTVHHIMYLYLNHHSMEANFKKKDENISLKTTLATLEGKLEKHIVDSKQSLKTHEDRTNSTFEVTLMAIEEVRDSLEDQINTVSAEVLELRDDTAEGLQYNTNNFNAQINRVHSDLDEFENKFTNSHNQKGRVECISDELHKLREELNHCVKYVKDKTQNTSFDSYKELQENMRRMFNDIETSNKRIAELEELTIPAVQDIKEDIPTLFEKGDVVYFWDGHLDDFNEIETGFFAHYDLSEKCPYTVFNSKHCMDENQASARWEHCSHTNPLKK